MISWGIACLVTLSTLLLVKPLATRLGLMDIPGGRKQHEHQTPLIGGIGIFIGSLSLALVSWSSFVSFTPLFTIAGLLLLVGAIDDAIDLSANLRLTTHLLAGSLMIFWGNNKLSSLGELLFTGPIMLGYMAVPVTLFAVASAINAINMTDGVDGLCGGLMLLFLLFMGYFAYSARLDHALMLIGVLCCCLISFLLLNFRFPWKSRASVFMGDAGSTVMGFILAWLLIYLAEHKAFSPAVALWTIAYPLLDTASVMAHRKLKGKGIFTPGRDHLHHLLLDTAGLSVRQTALALYTLAATLAGIGIIGHLLQLRDGTLFVGFLSLLFGYVGIIHYAHRQGTVKTYHRTADHPRTHTLAVSISNEK